MYVCNEPFALSVQRISLESGKGGGVSLKRVAIQRHPGSFSKHTAFPSPGPSKLCCDPLGATATFENPCWGGGRSDVGSADILIRSRDVCARGMLVGCPSMVAGLVSGW